jgi:hypothetical protein
VVGLDGAKVGVLDDGGKELGRALELKKDDKNVVALNEWWDTAKETATDDKAKVGEAGLFGGKMALTQTSYIPLTMAVLYLLLILYFKSQGGYKQVHVGGEVETGADMA